MSDLTKADLYERIHELSERVSDLEDQLALPSSPGEVRLAKARLRHRVAVRAELARTTADMAADLKREQDAACVQYGRQRVLAGIDPPGLYDTPESPYTEVTES